jgi:NAD(P)H-dependent FMN reductase
MKSVLIISATKGLNFQLTKRLYDILDKNVKKEYISLEDYDLPLFKASDYNELKNTYSDEIKKLTDIIVNVDGLIICAPEYNGNTPPIFSNAISWISVTTDYWRDAFLNKSALICTSSGGPAIKYSISMKNQLEHLGMVVMPRYISVTSSNPLDENSAKKILKQFLKHL